MMMKKYLLYTSTLLLLLVGCALLLASCQEGGPCADGHTPVTDPAVTATCTQRGRTEGSHCAVCNAVITAQQPVEPTAHTPGDWQTALAATCTQKGSKYRACTTCQTILELGEIDLATHTYEDWTVITPATCSGAGERHSTCTVCGDFHTEEISATAHTPGDWIIDLERTCTQPGLQHTACTLCGETLQLMTLIATGHTPGTPRVTTPATCTENGIQTTVCLTCGAEETSAIPAHGHTPGTPVVVLDSTCDKTGVQHVFCTVCETETPIAVEEIAAKGHNHGVWTLVAMPSCTAPGTEHSTCTKCGAVERRDVAPTNHSDANWTTVLEAANDVAGVQEGTCPTCGLDLGTRFVNPLNASTGFDVTLNNGTYTITGLGTCTDTRVVIPCYIDGYPVTVIQSLGNGSTVTDIVIPPSIKTLSPSVVSGQAGLVRVENGVKYVDRWAVGFVAESLPESVTLRAGTLGIMASAFSGCTVMKSLSIPASVRAIGTGITTGCTQLATLTVDANNGFYTAKGNCVIELATKTLVAGCKSSTIPTDGSVTAIGTYAFREQSSLSFLSIPASVTKIGNSAFYNSGIRTLVLPSGLETVESLAFGQLYNLSMLTMSQNGERFAVIDGCLVDRSTTTLLTATKNATIPTDGTVTRIGSYAFASRTDLQSIALPVGIRLIDSYAFFGCSTLSSVSLPNSVQTIYNSAFRNCTALTGISLPNGLSTLGSNAFYGCSSLVGITLPTSLSTVSSYAFYNCKALANVTLSTALTQISDYAFSGCSALHSITLPSTLQEIGANAFYNTGLYEVSIPESVTTIGPNAFKNCYKLVHIRNFSKIKLVSGTHYTSLSTGQQIKTDGTAFSYQLTGPDAKGCVTLKIGSTVYLFDYQGSAATLDLTGISFARVYPYAFYNNKVLTHLTLPTSLTRIESNAFYGCSALQSVSLPKVTSIGSNAFYNCSALQSLSLPKITSIGSNAFCNCKALETLTLNSGCSASNNTAFIGCSAIKVATLPLQMVACIPTNALEELTITSGDYIPAFMLADSLTLKKLVLPSSLLDLRTGAFTGCVNLKTATLPTTAIAKFPKEHLEHVTIIKGSTYKDGARVDHTTIPGLAFKDDAVLKHVIIGKDITAINGQAFHNCYGLESVTFEAKSYETLTLAGNTFTNATSLWKLELPNGVTKLPAQFAYGCTSLESFTIPSTVTVIGHEAFYQSGLVSITIPKSVTMLHHRIPDNTTRGTFGECLKLKSVVFESGSTLTQIANYCFQGCANLESISNIPASVTCIGKNAFLNCKKLTSVGFEVTSGWRCYATNTCTTLEEGFTTTSSGTAVSLPDTTTNATYLKSNYLNYFWKRS